MFKFSLAFWLLLLSVSMTAAQPDYSESRPYEPRRFSMPEQNKPRKIKNDSDNKKTDPNNVSNAGTSDKNVRIPVFVFDKKEIAVNDLRKADFKVFADNTEQEIVGFETAKTGRNFLLVVDTSPSLAFNDDDLRKFVGEMVKALQPDDKIQLVKFNQEPEILCEPTNDPKILQKAIKKIRMGDGTSLYDSMQIIYRKYLKLLPEKPVVILVTDGVDTTSRRMDYFSSLMIAEEYDTVVFPFYYDSYNDWSKRPVLIGLPVPGLPFPTSRRAGITKEEYALGRAYLDDIASLSGGKAYNVGKFSEIKKEDFEEVFKSINPQYYLTIKQPEGAPAGQRKQLKVRVNRPKLEIQARGSFITGAN
jgi:VWFA-related protein